MLISCLGLKLADVYFTDPTVTFDLEITKVMVTGRKQNADSKNILKHGRFGNTQPPLFELMRPNLKWSIQLHSISEFHENKSKLL